MPKPTTNTQEVMNNTFDPLEYLDSYDAKPCIDCQDHEKTKEGVAYWFQAILDELYGKEEIDIEAISVSIEECSHLLGIKCHNESLSLQRGCKVAPIIKLDVIQEWKSFNKNYLFNSYQTQAGAQ